MNKRPVWRAENGGVNVGMRVYPEAGGQRVFRQLSIIH